MDIRQRGDPGDRGVNLGGIFGEKLDPLQFYDAILHRQQL
jgi:hypothetical protein